MWVASVGGWWVPLVAGGRSATLGSQQGSVNLLPCATFAIEVVWSWENTSVVAMIDW